MTLRALLDNAIQRLGLCDRVDLLRVHSYLDILDAQRHAIPRAIDGDETMPLRYQTPMDDDEAPFDLGGEAGGA